MQALKLVSVTWMNANTVHTLLHLCLPLQFRAAGMVVNKGQQRCYPASRHQHYTEMVAVLQ